MADKTIGLGNTPAVIVKLSALVPAGTDVAVGFIETGTTVDEIVNLSSSVVDSTG